MKSLITWMLIRSSMEQNIPVMLLYVLESKGSSPGRQGFFMAVNAFGQMEGSIGGGMMEHKFVEMAKEQLRATPDVLPDGSLRKQVHDKSASKNQSGMICSGEQTILLYPVHPSDGPAIGQIIPTLQQHKNATIKLSPSGISFESSIPGTDYEFVIQSEVDWHYKEKLGYKNQLHIIGGGHCALAFSALMRQMDFYIRVYDDRPGLKTMQENDSAHEKHNLIDYSELNKLIPSGPSQYVVIMTFGYRTDDVAVRALIGKEFKFLGLLGSKTKIAKMFGEYEKEDIDEEWLCNIHTPVGLDIKSQTPEEIAISIAAEIIKVKNANLP